MHLYWKYILFPISETLILELDNEKKTKYSFAFCMFIRNFAANYVNHYKN